MCFEQNINDSKPHIAGIYSEDNEWFRDRCVELPFHIRKSRLLNKNELVNENYVGTYLSCDSEEHIRERIYDGERFPKFVRDLGEDRVIDYINEAMSIADDRFNNKQNFFDNSFYVQSMQTKTRNNIVYFIPVEFPLPNNKKYTMALAGRRFVEKDFRNRDRDEVYLDIHTIFRLEDALEDINLIKHPKLEEFQNCVLLENKKLEKEYNELEIQKLEDDMEMG